MDRLVMQEELRNENPVDNVKKKFYRDFTEDEYSAVESLREAMNNCYVAVPPFVIRKMIERGIVPSDLEILDEEGDFIKDNLSLLNEVPAYRFVEDAIFEGIAFEFSDEGFNNPYSPYRMVWAIEDKENDLSYFVKTPIPPKDRTVRVIDVWRKSGEIPFYPIPSQKEKFVKGLSWDLSKTINDMLIMYRTSIISNIG